MSYYSSSEFVSSGHPDRLADNAAAVLIDRIQKKDGPNSHAAIEVLITHDSIIFGGEATTTLEITNDLLYEVSKEAHNLSGYLPEMRKHWTKKEVVLADDLKIINNICAQSPDIALGTTNKGEDSGWNDQGVYYSSSENTNSEKLGTPMLLATLIGEALHHQSRVDMLEGNLFPFGPDNKVVVTVRTEDDGYTPIEVTAVTVAVAHTAADSIENIHSRVKSIVRDTCSNENIPISVDCKWVINGTGRFVVHGAISDTSLTGRKISVNHPSAGPVWCNKMIGGGSLVKPWHASDFLLNILSRYIANVVVSAGLSNYAVVGCAGAIGQHGVQSLFIKGDKEIPEKAIEFFENFIEWSPKGIADKFGLFNNFDYAEAVNANFFGHPIYQPWENVVTIHDDVQKLKDYIA